MWQNRLENLILTIWMGSHWSAGYLVAPVLFKTLDDRQLAGALAGQVFGIAAWIGFTAGVVLLLSSVVRDRMGALRAWRFWALLLMVALVTAGIFIMQPQMAALKAQGITAGTEAAAAFGRLHGISSIMHLLISLAGVALVWWGVRGNQPRPRSALGAL